MSAALFVVAFVVLVVFLTWLMMPAAPPVSASYRYAYGDSDPVAWGVSGITLLCLAGLVVYAVWGYWPVALAPGAQDVVFAEGTLGRNDCRFVTDVSSWRCEHNAYAAVRNDAHAAGANTVQLLFNRDRDGAVNGQAYFCPKAATP